MYVQMDDENEERLPVRGTGRLRIRRSNRSKEGRRSEKAGRLYGREETVAESGRRGIFLYYLTLNLSGLNCPASQPASWQVQKKSLIGNFETQRPRGPAMRRWSEGPSRARRGG